MEIDADVKTVPAISSRKRKLPQQQRESDANKSKYFHKIMFELHNVSAFYLINLMKHADELLVPPPPPPNLK